MPVLTSVTGCGGDSVLGAPSPSQKVPVTFTENHHGHSSQGLMPGQLGCWAQPQGAQVQLEARLCSKESSQNRFQCLRAPFYTLTKLCIFIFKSFYSSVKSLNNQLLIKYHYPYGSKVNPLLNYQQCSQQHLLIMHCRGKAPFPSPQRSWVPAVPGKQIGIARIICSHLHF